MNPNNEDYEMSIVEFNKHFLRGDIVPHLLRRIIVRREKVFPWKQGKQWVNDVEFSNLISDLRRMLLGMPVVEGSVNYYIIVREWLPLGSDFKPRSGYSTLEGIMISKTIRDKVKAIKIEYGAEAER